MNELVKIETGLFKVDSATSLDALSKIEINNDTTISQIRNLNTPPISSLAKPLETKTIVSKRKAESWKVIVRSDKTECYKLLKAMIVMLNGFLGISWPNELVAGTAEEMYSKCYYWSQADLKLFFKKARSNQFGEKKLLSSNQYSPMILMQWVDEYDKDWTVCSAEITESRHQEYSVDGKLRDHNYRQKLSTDIKDKVKSMAATISKQKEYIEQLKSREQ